MVMDRQGEYSWLWSWRRNEVVVDLMAHLNEEADDIARLLSWMDKQYERRRLSRGLKLQRIQTIACCRYCPILWYPKSAPPQLATSGTCTLATHRGLLSDGNHKAASVHHHYTRFSYNGNMWTTPYKTAIHSNLDK